MKRINIVPKLNYDEEEDVLYVTFGTGEPSYCEEIDDILLIERGLFTGAVTGFRILTPEKYKIREIEVIIHQKIEPLIKKDAKVLKNRTQAKISALKSLSKEIEEEMTPA